ncbi:hypothetical protein Adt_23325 [Abeliophyllum distichum]|uniref:Uncharacterized protein n=1 Tax=Abeliophyllum distichum TaxID=126358 RepID=A0ABD1SB06_9LAMI
MCQESKDTPMCFYRMLVMSTEVRRLGFIVTCRWVRPHLIGTLPDELQDEDEMVYDMLRALAVPILPREIDYEAFYTDLTALWEEDRDDAHEFLEAKRVEIG